MNNQPPAAGTSPRDLLEQLKAVAPLVHFSVTREIDRNFEWDGDGPDPELEGFYAYDVTVTARTIARGVMFEGHDYLGGSYFKHDEPCGDIHGYLPQMLLEAVESLRGQLNSTDELWEQLRKASARINAEMQRRYREQEKAR